jgi:hypothetical protein
MTNRDFSATIRAAVTGRSAPETNAPPVVGDLGIGRGSSASIFLAVRPEPTNMNALLRGARAVQRQRLADSASFYAEVEREATRGR